MVDQTRIAEIRDRIAAASPGPWVPSEDEHGRRVITTGRQDGRRFYIKHDDAPATEADVEFVALAREVLPRLLGALMHGTLDVFTDEELNRIERVVARASAGPWTSFLESRQPIGGSSMIWVGDEAHAADMYVWLEDEIAPDADIEFMAAARRDVPDLLSEIRVQRRRSQG